VAQAADGPGGAGEREGGILLKLHAGMELRPGAKVWWSRGLREYSVLVEGQPWLTTLVARRLRHPWLSQQPHSGVTGFRVSHAGFLVSLLCHVASVHDSYAGVPCNCFTSPCMQEPTLFATTVFENIALGECRCGFCNLSRRVHVAVLRVWQ
jgi:hypothetical protein